MSFLTQNSYNILYKNTKIYMFELYLCITLNIDLFVDGMNYEEYYIDFCNDIFTILSYKKTYGAKKPLCI